jgi:hypothetical protein
LMLYYYVSNKDSIYQAMVLAWEQPKLGPQTEFGLSPCTTALTTFIGSVERTL